MSKPILFTVAFVLLLGAPVSADTPTGETTSTFVVDKNSVSTTTTPPEKETKKENVEVGDPLLLIKKPTFTTQEEREKRIKKLVGAIAAIEDRGGKPLTRAQCDSRWKKRCARLKTDADPKRSGKAYRYHRCLRRWKRCYKFNDRWEKRRLTIAEAALSAQEKTGVDATFLIALGRMESDFRNLVLINPACKYGRRNYNCYADCGMTQHHVRGNLKYVKSYCAKLAKSPKLSFYKSAEELAKHVAYCTDPKRVKRHLPTRRCILNRYNQGTFYKRMERCSRCWYDPKKFVSPLAYQYIYQDCRRRRAKCRARAAYWKKLTCFEYGARHGIRSKHSCRRCYSLAKIRTRFYNPPQTDAKLTSFLFKKPASK